MVGATIEFESEYPEWQYNPDSKIRTVFENVYNNLYGAKPEIELYMRGLNVVYLMKNLMGILIKYHLDLISMMYTPLMNTLVFRQQIECGIS